MDLIILLQYSILNQCRWYSVVKWPIKQPLFSFSPIISVFFLSLLITQIKLFKMAKSEVTVAEVSSLKVKAKAKLSLCFQWALGHEGVLGDLMCSSTHLDLGTRWRWVVSFKPRSLYPQGKNPRYPLDRRLGGPLEAVVKRKIPSPYRDSNPP
jgi:hypothetical protein